MTIAYYPKNFRNALKPSSPWMSSTGCRPIAGAVLLRHRHCLHVSAPLAGAVSSLSLSPASLLGQPVATARD
ncbi:hypothetical protein TIFTF001_030996 [Ficus carica]|uniref:Uncharacterized protein n=1 Tax=Ficus carica TaxID=3494 RepID=A0AA88J4W0_FICCA|nr:hypothetical protein TIFTF001_030996 [Ficus carica]